MVRFVIIGSPIKRIYYYHYTYHNKLETSRFRFVFGMVDRVLKLHDIIINQKNQSFIGAYVNVYACTRAYVTA